MSDTIRIAVNEDARDFAQELCRNIEDALYAHRPNWAEKLQDHIDETAKFSFEKLQEKVVGLASRMETVAREQNEKIPDWARQSLPTRDDCAAVSREIGASAVQITRVATDQSRQILEKVRTSLPTRSEHTKLGQDLTEMRREVTVAIDTAIGIVQEQGARLDAVLNDLVSKVSLRKEVSQLGARVDGLANKAEISAVFSGVEALNERLEIIAVRQGASQAEHEKLQQLLKEQATVIGRLSRPWYRRIFG